MIPVPAQEGNARGALLNTPAKHMIRETLKANPIAQTE